MRFRFPEPDDEGEDILLTGWSTRDNTSTRPSGIGTSRLFEGLRDRDATRGIRLNGMSESLIDSETQEDNR